MEETPTILVTGAGRGLGRGIALELARAGFSVGVNYAANVEAAGATVDACRAAAPGKHQSFIPLQADISSAPERDGLVEQMLRHFGRIDALVNNAGIGPRVRVDLLDADEGSFEEVLRTNLQGPYFLTREVARYWLKDRPGSTLPGGHKVVFVTSISSHTASLNRGEYCVSKAGLSMAVQLWAARLAPESIPVYEIRPGIMETDMTAGVRGKYDALLEQGVVPQQRWGTPHDVGQAVRMLLEGHLPFSTGTIIDVDGGFHIRRL